MQEKVVTVEMVVLWIHHKNFEMWFQTGAAKFGGKLCSITFEFLRLGPTVIWPSGTLD